MLLLKVGTVHGTHYETTNPSLVCTNPTSSGQTAGSNLAVIASVRSSRAMAGWAPAGGGEALAPRPRTALRIGLRQTARLDLNDCKRDECYEPPTLNSASQPKWTCGHKLIERFLFELVGVSGALAALTPAWSRGEMEHAGRATLFSFAVSTSK